MSTEYFDWPGSADRFVRFDTVRSADVNAALDLASAGFAKLPTPLQVWSGGGNYAADSGAVNAMVASIATSYNTSLYDGMTVRVKAAVTNTGAATLNLNGLGAKAVLRPDGTVLQAGDIKAGQVAHLTYLTALGAWQISTLALGAVGPTGATGASGYTGRRALAANYGVTLATNDGELLACTADLTLTFSPIANLGTSFSCRVAAIDCTVTIDSSDGLTNWKMYPGERRFFYSDGTTLRSVILATFKYVPTTSVTFIEPPGYAAYDVYIQAPGGGGGSGRRGAAGANRGGGGGGGGGAMAQGIITAGTPGATVTITVGTPGPGGAAQTVNTTDGSVGTAGGTSSWGTALTVAGGSAGTAGTNVASAASATTAAGNGHMVLLGGPGGASVVTGAATAPTAIATWSASGGGGGGGIDNADIISTGAAGGISGSLTASTQLAGGTAGSPGGVGKASTAMMRRGGTGGGGGTLSALGAAGATGGAGVRGGGGGGGSASVNGFASGAGGAGGAGYFEIVGIA